MIDIAGEVAAVGTAISFAVTAVFLTLAGRGLGSPLVNRARLLIALPVVLLLHWLIVGQPIPSSVTSTTLFWLAISGIIGLALGDASLFQSYLMVGPRIGMLMMSLAPVITVILSWIFLGEVLSTMQLLGITIAVFGVVGVVSERNPTRSSTSTSLTIDNRMYWLGILFAFGGALGQATGLVTSKIGLGSDFDPLSANLIRITLACVVVWLFAMFRGKFISSFTSLRDHPRATRSLLAGTMMGPVIGVWLSLVAVQRSSSLGIASTLMALSPIFLLPIARIVFGEEISYRAIIGTIVAVIGVAIIFV